MTALFAWAAISSPALADSVVAEYGTGAGQVSEPRALAVDTSNGRLYVADFGNSRIDVFNSSDQFLFAFGWGVRQGGVSGLTTCTAEPAEECRAGSSGSGAGQFSGISGIAVDSNPLSASFHSIYVSEYGTNRIQKFSPSGAFVLAFGKGVNKTTNGDVCTAASGNICGTGAAGPGNGELGGSMPIAMGPGGTVYVGSNVPSQAGTDRVQIFDDAGLFQQSISVGFVQTSQPVDSLAVQGSGDFYIAYAGPPSLSTPAMRKYSSGGTLLGSIAAPYASSLATDVTDNVYIATSELISGVVGSILELNSNSEPIRRFGYELSKGDVHGLAVAVTGDVYANGANGGLPDGSLVLRVSPPAPGPVLLRRPCRNTFVGNIKANVECFVNPEDDPTTLHFQYVDRQGFDSNEFEECGLPPSPGHLGNPNCHETDESESIGEDFELHGAQLAVEGLAPETKYHYRAIATNASGGPVFGPDSTVITREPFELGGIWATEVRETTAALNAEVNPLGVPAEGYFEYVEDAVYREDVESAEADPSAIAAAQAACEEVRKRAEELGKEPEDEAACVAARLREHGFERAQRAPATPAKVDFGAGEGFVARGASLSDLAPGTTYHYRLVVADSFKSAAGPERMLSTQLPPGAALPDDRGYELVSSANKEGGEAGNPSAAGGLFDVGHSRIQQASVSGEAFTFTSFTAFADPKSAPGAVQYLARRSPSGWHTANITPLGEGVYPLDPPVRGFTPDLAYSAIAIPEPALTPQASSEYENLYLQQNETGSLSTLTPASPAGGPQEYCVGFGGSTPDGSRAFLLASGALTEDAPVKAGFSLYEWSASEGLQLVSKLPGEVVAQPSGKNGFGAAGVGCGDGGSIVRHAVSSDGRRVFWTFVPKSGATRLLARISNEETVQIDAKQGGLGAAGEGKYWGASADGSAVVFSDRNRLTPSAANDSLYRYDLEAPLGARLTNLTPAAAAANVKGVLGMSEDSTWVYFVATGVLTEEENSRDETATVEANNLYLWHQGEPVRFIATLAPTSSNNSGDDDRADWSAEPARQTARVSPNGHSLAFMSYRSLTGYDNTVSGQPGCALHAESTPGNHFSGATVCAEAFLYDADTHALACASCNPTGSRPLGPTELPGWSSPFEQPRYLSDDGKRLFFQTFDALSPGDKNGEGDVYEFELPGAGSCTSQSPEFSELSGGCVFLVSTGTSTDNSYFLDASPDGLDVFFSTRQRLVGQDEDDSFDVYDARIRGGFPSPPVNPAACAGEGSCRGGVVSPPGQVSPGTQSAFSEGNIKPSGRCPKGKHRARKHGKSRCVKHGRGGKGKKRASQDRGAAR